MRGQADSRVRYRGRLAPSPTGFLHLGHARTFWIAQERAVARGGTLVLRNEDLDRSRVKPEFVPAMLEDLRWLGLRWQEGPDVGGPFAPYAQSQRQALYEEALEKLRRRGLVYPCHCSRQDVLRAVQAPHVGEEEPIYPGTCRPGRADAAGPKLGVDAPAAHRPDAKAQARPKVNWRFAVPDAEEIRFTDGYYGEQRFVAGKDFGDFIVWRHDGVPAYQLAVVVDDALMRITEVVRGEDLLKSTARQLLLYRALGWEAPAFYHCPLMTDEAGLRLAKRHDALSLRALRAGGKQPEQLRRDWAKDAVGPSSLSSSS